MIAKKELGQNWLGDSEALRATVAAADIAEGDAVLEVGPGLGYLTDKLIQSGANVTALEFDRDLLGNLTKKYEYLEEGRFNLIIGDIRKFDLSTLATPYKLCANIPYYLTSNLLRILTDSSSKPIRASVLVQKEVAERVAADSKRSKLAIIVQSVYDVELGRVVEAKLFDPQPKVDSQILSLSLRSDPLVSVDKWKDFTAMIGIAYSSPRKTLRSNFVANMDKDKVEELLSVALLTNKTRAEELTDQQWQKLFSEYTRQI